MAFATTSIPPLANASTSCSLPLLSETKIPNQGETINVECHPTDQPDIRRIFTRSLACAADSASLLEKTPMEYVVGAIGRSAFMSASPCSLDISRQESAFLSRTVSSSALAARSFASATFSPVLLSNSDCAASPRWEYQYSAAQQIATATPRQSRVVLGQSSRWSVNDQPRMDSVVSAATSTTRKTNSDLENLSISERSSDSVLDWRGWIGLSLTFISLAFRFAWKAKRRS